MSLKPTSGRSGLDKIDVTPAVFLQLRAQLQAGKNLPFNEPQLLIAFSRYLHDNKGRWTRSQIKGTRDLHKFAEKYVAHETAKLKQILKTDPKKPQTRRQVSAKQQQAEKFLQDRGLKLLGDKDLPKAEKQHGNQEILGKENMKRGVETTEIVAELFSIARAAEPATAVAAVLLSRALLPNLSSMAIDGTYVLLDKFENRAKNDQQKNIVLHGLEEVTTGLSTTIFNQEFLRLQEKEKQNPDANPEHLKRLEQLRGASEIKAEQAAKEKREEQELQALLEQQQATLEHSAEILSSLEFFHENIADLVHHSDAQNKAETNLDVDAHADAEHATQQHVAATQNHAVQLPHPFGQTWDISKGPKPPTQEIFGTPSRHDDDVE